MDANSRARKALAECSPLAPMCEQYLDLATLGSKNDRTALIEIFEELYVERDYESYDGKPTVAARRFVKALDDVTANILLTSYHSGLITMSTLKRLASNFTSNNDVRNYTLLQIAIHGVEAKSGTTRQFYGLNDLTGEGPDFGLSLDLSTDEKYRGNAACLRYAVMVTNGLPIHEGTQLFLFRRNDDMIIIPEMKDLLWRRPEQADMIAAIVIARGVQNAGLIETMLDDEIAPPMSSGTL